jgi:spore coat protein CotH
MHRVRFGPLQALAAAVFLVPACGVVQAAQDRLFAQDRVTAVEIEMDPAGVAKLQADPRSYVTAIVRVDTHAFPNAQVHLKGHGSFLPITDKPNLMVRLDEGSASKRAFGHRRLLLNNSSQDPTFLRWKLASELFLKAGLPAARVNFAQVKLNGRALGLYVMVEPTDKPLLTQNFGSASGNLYEGSNTDVEDKLQLHSGDPSDGQQDLHALAQACREPDLQRRWDRLREILDVERFASFMAMEVLICHHDGYCLDRNNFQIYHDPRTDHMVFIPHGMDLIFDRPQLPLDGEFRGTVARALVETNGGKQLYRRRLAELAQMVYGSNVLESRITDLASWLGDHGVPAENRARWEASVAEFKQVVRNRKQFALSAVHAPRPD